MQLAEHMAEQAQGTRPEAKEAAFVKAAEKKEKKEAGGSQSRPSVPETAGGRYINPFPTTCDATVVPQVQRWTLPRILGQHKHDKDTLVCI